MVRMKYLFTFLFLSIFLVACEPEGPMERAGKALDEAVENTGEALEDTQEKIEKTIEKQKK